MKLLDYAALDELNLFLNRINLGKSTLKGSIEAYSCKHTGGDRKLSFSLEHEILDYLGQSLESDSASPVEKLSSRSSRKTLIYLILTLSHMYPDYDFSAIQAHNFFKEEGWDYVKQMFDTYMFEADKEWSELSGGTLLLESMCKAIDEVVKLEECEIYSYNPDFDENPFLEKGTIWAFNFFFYSRKLKRLVSFRCCCISNLVTDDYLTDDDEKGGSRFLDDEDESIFLDMDM